MTPEIKNKEKDMKKILLSLLAVFLIGALVISCDSNAKNISDETATVSFATSMGRSLSAQVSYIGFNQLDWEYKATLTSNTGFSYGQVTSWTTINLSETREFSQGIWKFELRAKTKGDNPQEVYYGYKNDVLIKKQSTPVPVLINVSPVTGGTGAISFGPISIVGKNQGETKTANKALITGDNTSIEIALPCEKQVVPAGSYSVVVSCVNQYGTAEEYVVSASETIDVQVFSGADVLISGNIAEGTQSAIFNPSLEVPETVFAKQLPVSITSEGAVVTVSEEKKIKNDTLVVTYPQGTILKDSNADSVTNTADAVTGFKYVSDTPSSSGIIVSASESVAQYELTLNVAEGNDVLLTVEKIIEKDLFITKVLHDGNELAKTPAPEGEPAREYYSYNEENGKLTLYLFHASPIDIITLDTSLLPENARIVMNLQELKDAINGMHDGDYIAFGANIVQDEVNTSSGQITPTKASDAEGEVNATIDLNGYVFDGQVGGWVFSDTEGFKLNIIGTDKVSAGYYEHATGHHMVKAHAVNLYFNDALGTMTIKDGMFVCNNAVLANGNGNLVVDNGEFVAEDGIILTTYNKGTTVINDGKFVTKKKNATFVDLELNDRSTSYQEVIINDGTFVMEDSNCAGFVIDVSYCLNSEDKYGSITINGGKFTFAENSELVVALSWTGDPKVVKDSSLNNDAYKEIAKNSVIIKGGTFNLDPTYYVAEGYTAVANSNGTWTVKQVTTN